MSAQERIAKRREELNMTQTELAKRAGLKPPAISQYESGARSPSYEALMKLSNALGVTTDYLMSGADLNSDLIKEKTAKILFHIIQDMSVENKEKLLQYAFFLTNASSSPSTIDIPVFSSTTEYADYIHKNFSNRIFPVDVYSIAEQLNVSIYENDLTAENSEGVLVKNNGKYFILLDKKITNRQRKKFTISTLLGHLLIPWHTKSNYSIRKHGTSTLLTDKTQQMEAQNFAAQLIMPQGSLAKILIKDRISIDFAKEISTREFDVSLFAFLNRIVSLSKSKYAVVQSVKDEIKKTFQGNRPLVETVNIQTHAYSFYENQPQVEEIRGGEVPANYWFTDALDNELIYEESIFNPNFGTVLTLLTVKS